MTNSDFLTVGEVLELVPFGKTTLYRLINDGIFPRQVPLAANVSRWYRPDVEKYLESLTQKKADK